MLARGVGLLDLGDLVDMSDGDGRGDYVAGAAAAGFDAGGLLEEPGDGGRLDNELEGIVLVGGDGDGHGCVGLVLLGARIEVLAEGHQVEPVLPEGGADGRGGAGAAGWHREADGGGNGPPGYHILQRRHSQRIEEFHRDLRRDGRKMLNDRRRLPPLKAAKSKTLTLSLTWETRCCRIVGRPGSARAAPDRSVL